jgi:hypothetical protein
VEFSENRLNQMELILRYTLFEGFVLKIVGNILWEYPDLRNRPIHEQEKIAVSGKRINKWLKQHPWLEGLPEAERVAWTARTVESVDRLPFHESNDGSRLCLSSYLQEAFGLEFHVKDLWPRMERIRRARNHLVHSSLEWTVPIDTMKDAEGYLANFPAFLVQKAAKPFPRACVEETEEESDDGTPGYKIRDRFMRLLEAEGGATTG